jgi:hypothetical protein
MTTPVETFSQYMGALPTANPLSGADVFVVLQAGVAKKTAATNITTIQANGTLTSGFANGQFLYSDGTKVQPGTFGSGLNFSGGTLTSTAGIVIGTSPVTGGSAGNLLYTDGAHLQATGGITFTSPGQLALATGAVTANAPILNLSQTWNNAAVSFTAFQVITTNTASVAGSSYIAVFQNTGGANPVSFAISANGISGSGTYTFDFGLDGDGASLVYNTSYLTFYTGTLQAGNFAQIAGLNVWQLVRAQTFNSVGSNSVSQDTWIVAQAPGVLGLMNQTLANPAGFQVYNKNDSYGAPANYERGTFDFTTNTNALTIGTQQAGTGVGRPIILKSGGSGIVNTFRFQDGAANNIARYDGASGVAQLYGNWPFGWGSGDAASTTMDTALSREAAGILQLFNFGSKTTGCGWHVYNTTDASPITPTNYERAAFDWTTSNNVLTIGTQKGGSGQTRNLQIVVGNTNQLDFGITNASVWTTPASLVLSSFITTGSLNHMAGSSAFLAFDAATVNFNVQGAPTGWMFCGSGYDSNGSISLAWYNSHGMARATANTIASNTTVLATATGMSVALQASRNYSFIVEVSFTCTAAQGIRAAMVATASLTASNIVYDGYIIDSAANGIKGNAQATSLGTVVANAAITGTAGHLRIAGTITVGVAGTLNFQFAQSSAAANATTVLQGSYMMVWDMP